MTAKLRLSPLVFRVMILILFQNIIHTLQLLGLYDTIATNSFALFLCPRQIHGYWQLHTQDQKVCSMDMGLKLFAIGYLRFLFAAIFIFTLWSFERYFHFRNFTKRLIFFIEIPGSRIRQYHKYWSEKRNWREIIVFPFFRKIQFWYTAKITS